MPVCASGLIGDQLPSALGRWNNTKCLGSDGAVHVEGHTENDARITQPTLSYTPARENCKPARRSESLDIASASLRCRLQACTLSRKPAHRSASQHVTDASRHIDVQTSM